MSLASQVRRQTMDQDNRARAGEFVMLARSLLAGGAEGTLGALEAAKASRATERVQAILKAAVTAGTTTDTSQLIGYSQVAEGFLKSLRNDSAYQAILSNGSFRQVPFRSRLGIVTTGASGLEGRGARPQADHSSLSVTGDQPRRRVQSRGYHRCLERARTVLGSDRQRTVRRRVARCGRNRDGYDLLCRIARAVACRRRAPAATVRRTRGPISNSCSARCR